MKWPNRELGDFNYVLAPLVSLLFVFGGWQIKGVRRIGIPIAIILFAYLYHRLRKPKNWAVYLSVLGLSFGVLTLPFTLIGDGLGHHWLNCPWIVVLGAFYAISMAPLTYLKPTKFKPYAIAATSFSCLFATMFILSNSPIQIPHKIVEIAVGLGYGLLASWLIGSET